MPEPLVEDSDNDEKGGAGCSAPEPLHEDSIFLSEWLAGNRYPNQLPISAVCNSHCIFCSNRLNPFPVATGIFRDLSDIKHQLSLMPFHSDPIRMSDRLPGRIAEGEAFLHPRFFEILAIIRRKYIGNTLCFTTNASMLDEPFLRKLAGFRPVQIMVSMHTTQLGLWTRIFRKSDDDARTAVQAPGLIRKYRIELQGTIVPLPGICGWEDIEHTYGYFVSQGATAMTLYWPGYTVCSSPEVIEEIAYPLDEFTAFAERMRSKHSVPLFAQPEMKAPLTLPVKRIMAMTIRGNLKARGGPFQKVVWLASEAAFPRLQHLVSSHAPSLPNEHHVFPVPNRTYGGNIMVAGLLMVPDFIEAGRRALERWPDTGLFLVPKTPFDMLNRDLQRIPAYTITEALGVPVWLVDQAANVDPLLNRLFFKEARSPGDALKETMSRFNAVFEDEKAVGTSLDLVDAYPIRTGWGNLNREELREKLLQEKHRTPAGQKHQFQGFELLGSNRCICIERWPSMDEVVTYRKWTFLVKRESRWRIQEIFQGEDEDMIRGDEPGV